MWSFKNKKGGASRWLEFRYLGVSEDNGTPKWMVLYGKPY